MYVKVAFDKEVTIGDTIYYVQNNWRYGKRFIRGVIYKITIKKGYGDKILTQLHVKCDKQEGSYYQTNVCLTSLATVMKEG